MGGQRRRRNGGGADASKASTPRGRRGATFYRRPCSRGRSRICARLPVRCWFPPTVCYIRRALPDYLIAKPSAKGAQLNGGEESDDGAGAGGVRLDGGTELYTSWIVNASGADAPRLTRGLPIRKRRGHLAITDRYPGFVRHQLVELGYLKRPTRWPWTLWPSMFSRAGRASF